MIFRAKGKSISRALTCVLIMVTLKLYLPIKNLLTDYGLFYCFAVLITLSVPLTFNKDICCQKKKNGEDFLPSNWFYLPETSDKKLAQVQYLYTQKSIEKHDIPTIVIWLNCTPCSMFSIFLPSKIKEYDKIVTFSNKQKKDI